MLREEPALVATLLRDPLGVAVPAFATAEVADADFTDVVPVEWRADLVVYLRGGAEHQPVMGVVVEIQRARDDAKRRSWPSYVAALHARLRCQTCLIVVATDQATARWAAKPILSLQLGSPFIPLVIGPDDVPRVAIDRVQDDPELAVLSGLIHGNEADGTPATLAALAALSHLSKRLAKICYDLICVTLTDSARCALEDQMEPGKYEYQSEFARRYFGEGLDAGRQEGRQEGQLSGARDLLLALADRHGAIPDDPRRRVVACADPDQLRDLAIELASATDRSTVERVLARLPLAATEA